jgi:hypothetical protein
MCFKILIMSANILTLHIRFQMSEDLTSKPYQLGMLWAESNRRVWAQKPKEISVICLT